MDECTVRLLGGSMDSWVDKQVDVLTDGWLHLWLFNDTVTQAIMANGRVIDNKLGRPCRRGHGMGGTTTGI